MRCISDAEIAQMVALGDSASQDTTRSRAGAAQGRRASRGPAHDYYGPVTPDRPRPCDPADEIVNPSLTDASTPAREFAIECAHDQDATMGRTLGEELKEQCKLRGISQNQAADFIGVSAQSFSKWALGERVPGNEHLPMVARFLRTSIKEVVALGEQGQNEVTLRLDRIELQLARLESLMEILIEPPKKPRR